MKKTLLLPFFLFPITSFSQEYENQKNNPTTEVNESPEKTHVKSEISVKSTASSPQMNKHRKLEGNVKELPPQKKEVLSKH